MPWWLVAADNFVHVGDYLEVMPGTANSSVDAIVTDPPYRLAFMGKRWVYDVPCTAIWAECLRVLKPGGHLLAFAGPAPSTAWPCAFEDAGVEIRDMTAWVYGSGFPKSHNDPWGGTALKPALEPITVARKPLTGTVAANCGAHGSGSLNIDGCRIPTDEKLGGGDQSAAAKTAAEGRARPWMQDEIAKPAHADRVNANVAKAEALGRWPAKLIHDGSDDVLAAFPAAPRQKANASEVDRSPRLSTVCSCGLLPRSGEPSATSANCGDVVFKMRLGTRRTDTGSAARFFYCAGATREERDAKLEPGPVPAVAANATMGDREGADWQARNGNHHPTVEPTDLMPYLCSLVTPADRPAAEDAA